jgi:hypothetical protein
VRRTNERMEIQTYLIGVIRVSYEITGINNKQKQITKQASLTTACVTVIMSAANIRHRRQASQKSSKLAHTHTHTHTRTRIDSPDTAAVIDDGVQAIGLRTTCPHRHRHHCRRCVVFIHIRTKLTYHWHSTRTASDRACRKQNVKSKSVIL